MTQSGHRAEAPSLDYGQLLALRAEHGEPTDEEVENYLRLPGEMLQSGWDAEVVRVRNWLSRGGETLQ